MHGALAAPANPCDSATWPRLRVANKVARPIFVCRLGGHAPYPRTSLSRKANGCRVSSPARPSKWLGALFGLASIALWWFLWPLVLLLYLPRQLVNGNRSWFSRRGRIGRKHYWASLAFDCLHAFIAGALLWGFMDGASRRDVGAMGGRSRAGRRPRRSHRHGDCDPTAA